MEQLQTTAGTTTQVATKYKWWMSVVVASIASSVAIAFKLRQRWKNYNNSNNNNKGFNKEMITEITQKCRDSVPGWKV
jgi:hypothetical protein